MEFDKVIANPRLQIIRRANHGYTSHLGKLASAILNFIKDTTGYETFKLLSLCFSIFSYLSCAYIKYISSLAIFICNAVCFSLSVLCF